MSAAVWMESRWWLAMGWTMVHFLWAGAVVGVAALAARWWLRSSSPQWRYLGALFSLGLLAASTVLLATWQLAEHGAGAGAPPAAASASRFAPAGDLGAVEAGAESRPPDSTSILPGAPAPAAAPWRLLRRGVAWLPWLWISGSSSCLLLFLLGAAGAARLRRDAVAAPPPFLQECCARLRRRCGVTAKVAVRLCERVRCPLLAGVLRPVILFPPAALTGLTPEQVEMVLLHELAHLLRRDNLVLVFQKALEALLFFHPATWWISRWIREEREACCDAFVLQHTGRAADYARALLALAPAPGAGPALASYAARRPLVARVARILGHPERTMKPTLGTLGMLAAALLSAAGLAALAPVQEPGAASAHDLLLPALERQEGRQENCLQCHSSPHSAVVAHACPRLEPTAAQPQCLSCHAPPTQEPEEETPPCLLAPTRLELPVGQLSSRSYVLRLDDSAFRLDLARTRPGIADRLLLETPGWITGRVLDSSGRLALRPQLTWRLSTGSPPEPDLKPLFSPDRSQVLFYSYAVDQEQDGGAGRPDRLYWMSVASGETRPLGQAGGKEYDPAWSPDGRSVAFVAEREGGSDVYLVEVESGQERRLTADPRQEARPRWSQDGQWIAFELRGDGGEATRMVVSASLQLPVELTPEHPAAGLFPDE